MPDLPHARRRDGRCYAAVRNTLFQGNGVLRSCGICGEHRRADDPAAGWRKPYGWICAACNAARAAKGARRA